MTLEGQRIDDAAAATIVSARSGEVDQSAEVSGTRKSSRNRSE